MAGGFGGKLNPKIKNYKTKGFTSEVLNNSPNNFAPKKNNLSGILKPGETFKVNPESPNFGKEFFNNYLQKEQDLVASSRQTSLQKEIDLLLNEIKKLINSTNNLSEEIENIPLEQIVENSEYQVNFLVRIKNLIVNFRQNISESSIWLECLNSKKKKKNSYWSKARNKKSGGEQYLFSGEHTASRSAN